MIAVDTSALMAIILKEPQAAACNECLWNADDIIISAGTVVEAFIVASRRDAGDDMAALLDGLGPRIIAVTPAAARRIADVHTKWGKGVHPAALNFGDCFSYDTAREHNCRLLFIGNDFAQTDIASAL